jgi:GNAT superfamily N-acetyltransferase
MIEAVNTDKDFKNIELKHRCAISSKSRNTKHYIYKESGCEAGFISLDFIQGVDSLVLYELFISTDLRNRGVATRILQELMTFAVENGYSKISVNPSPLDSDLTKQELIQWYQRNGFITKNNGTGEFELIVSI